VPACRRRDAWIATARLVWSEHVAGKRPAGAGRNGGGIGLFRFVQKVLEVGRKPSRHLEQRSPGGQHTEFRREPPVLSHASSSTRSRQNGAERPEPAEP